VPGLFAKLSFIIAACISIDCVRHWRPDKWDYLVLLAFKLSSKENLCSSNLQICRLNLSHSWVIYHMLL
jgi:hypothetical protein